MPAWTPSSAGWAARACRAPARRDRAIWAEFAAEAEDAYARLDPERAAREAADVRLPTGETDVARVVADRRVQSFFRAAVMTSYASRCAISGLAMPELLVVSHIIPWADSVERRADPRNGLCLNALFDRAFDRGLITIDTDLRVVVSTRLREGTRSAELACSLQETEGRRLLLPERFPPAPEALEHHRERIFQSR